MLADVDETCCTEGNHLFYLATPPTAYAGIVRSLGEAGLVKPDGNGKGWNRIIIEKPFGRDLGSAQELNRHVLGVVRERQVYRIDHYLGKETVQNILAFRFGNSLFEPLWNRRYMDHVQIMVAEDLGAEGRGEYYERAGALRDMAQNHMLQLLSLVAMEPPAAFDAEAIRDEKVKLLRAARRLSPERVRAETVRGQYTAGTIGRRTLVGYREESGVAQDSTTETYAALRLTMTIGAGPGCRSTSERARRWRSGSRKSPSSTASRRCSCSSTPRTRTTRGRTVSSRTACRFEFSRTSGSCSDSGSSRPESA